LDQVLHRLRQQSHDACVAAREKAADSTAAAGYQCERILARPAALGRQGGPGPGQQ
jgi:hypothetical protein